MKISISEAELKTLGNAFVSACAEVAKIAPQFLETAANVVINQKRIFVYRGPGSEHVRFLTLEGDSTKIVYMNEKETVIEWGDGDDIDALTDKAITDDLVEMGLMTVQDPSQEPLPDSYPIKVIRIQTENDTPSPQV